MLNWVAILKRILKLYGLHSARELGMALGVPIRRGEGGQADEEIPWPILEMVVADKGVSWDWVLTGRNFRPESADTKPILRQGGGGGGDGDETPERRPSRQVTATPVPESAPVAPPRLETRELERTLLTSESQRLRAAARAAEIQPPAPTPAPPPPPPVEPAEVVNERREQDVLLELQDIRESMRRELERVEKIMREQRNKYNS